MNISHYMQPAAEYGGIRPVMVWDSKRESAVVIDVPQANGIWLLAWELTWDGAKPIASSELPDGQPLNLQGAATLAAAYDPVQNAIVAITIVNGRYDHTHANTVAIWTLRGETVQLLHTSTQTFSEHQVAACWDGSRRRVVVAIDKALYSVEAHGLAPILSHEHESPLVPVYDATGRRLLLLGSDVIAVVDGNKLVHLECPEDWTGRVAFAGHVGDCVYAVNAPSYDDHMLGFEIRGTKVTKTKDVMPNRSQTIAVATWRGFVGLATRELRGRECAPCVFELTRGAGTKAYRERMLVRSRGVFVANSSLVHVSDGQIAARDRDGAWLEWSPTGKVPNDVPGDTAFAVDEDGRLLMYNRHGELRAVKNGKWSLLSEKKGPKEREFASLAATATEVLLFGGTDLNGRGQNDTWRFAGGAWKQIKTKHAPRKRKGALAWPLPDGGTLLCAGYAGDRPLNDVWMFDGKDWRQAGTMPAEAVGDDQQLGFVATAIDPKTGAPLAVSETSDGHVLWLWNEAAWQRVASMPRPAYPGLPADMFVSYRQLQNHVALDPAANVMVYLDQSPVARTVSVELPALAAIAAPAIAAAAKDKRTTPVKSRANKPNGRPSLARARARASREPAVSRTD